MKGVGHRKGVVWLDLNALRTSADREWKGRSQTTAAQRKNVICSRRNVGRDRKRKFLVTDLLDGHSWKTDVQVIQTAPRKLDGHRGARLGTTRENATQGAHRARSPYEEKGAKGKLYW